MTITTNTFQTYGNPQLPRFNKWVDSVEIEFDVDSEAYLSDWTEYILTYASTSLADILPVGLQPETNKLAWVEEEPAVRGDKSLDLIYQHIYGTEFDFDSPHIEGRFLDFIEENLNPFIAAIWFPFRFVSAEFHGYAPDDYHQIVPRLARDFCDHALMWHHAQSVPLLETPEIDD
jgi:hypothetical protein